MSESLWPHGLQHPRLPLPLSSPEVCSDSCPLSWWCHPTISPSVAPFSYLQSFPASGSFLMSRLFASGGQSIGASASASVLPMNIQDWFPLGWTGWISLLSNRLSRVFHSPRVGKQQFFGAQPSLWSSSHIHTWPFSWTSELQDDKPALLGATKFVVTCYSGSRKLILSCVAPWWELCSAPHFIEEPGVCLLQVSDGLKWTSWDSL